MDRFFTLETGKVEAAWLDTHPLVPVVDGLLLPFATGNKDEYIDCLEEADRGNLRDFIGYVARLSSQSTARAIQIGNRILDGRDRMHHANGGITVNGDYHPPFSEKPTDLDRD